MNDEEFYRVIDEGLGGESLSVDAPAAWTVQPPPHRVPEALKRTASPRAGLPVTIGKPGAFWSHGFVLAEQQVKELDLPGVEGRAPFVRVAQQSEWEAGGAVATKWWPLDWAYTYTDATAPDAPDGGPLERPASYAPRRVDECGSIIGRPVRVQLPHDADEMVEGAWSWWVASGEPGVYTEEPEAGAEPGEVLVPITTSSDWSALLAGDPDSGAAIRWFAGVAECWTY